MLSLYGRGNNSFVSYPPLCKLSLELHNTKKERKEEFSMCWKENLLIWTGHWPRQWRLTPIFFQWAPSSLLDSSQQRPAIFFNDHICELAKKSRGQIHLYWFDFHGCGVEKRLGGIQYGHTLSPARRRYTLQASVAQGNILCIYNTWVTLLGLMLRRYAHFSDSLLELVHLFL